MAATKDLQHRELAERLVLLRNRTGLAQWQVADKLRVRQSTLSQWELGNSEPRLLQALVLADLYGVSLYVLAGREPLPPATQRPHRYRSDEAESECASICSP